MTILLTVLVASTASTNPFDSSKKAAISSGTAEEEFIRGCIDSQFGNTNLTIDLYCPEVIVIDRELNRVVSGNEENDRVSQLIRQSGYLTTVHDTKYFLLDYTEPVHEQSLTGIAD